MATTAGTRQGERGGGTDTGQDAGLGRKEEQQGCSVCLAGCRGKLCSSIDRDGAVTSIGREQWPLGTGELVEGVLSQEHVSWIFNLLPHLLCLLWLNARLGWGSPSSRQHRKQPLPAHCWPHINPSKLSLSFSRVHHESVVSGCLLCKQGTPTAVC